MQMMERNRAQRAQEEKERKEKLRQEYLAEKKRTQDALDKEMAIIRARAELERAEKEKAKEVDNSMYELLFKVYEI
eukprot:m.252241 g.252241  ORF g.252241 m.252241 type:complete len:76 (-) comp16154_c0_seq39:22-249(-)